MNTTPAILTIFAIVVTAVTSASAEPPAHKDPVWSSCVTAQDCVVINVGGCLGTEVINKRYEKEFREWSRVENLRLNCHKDPKLTPLPIEALVVNCVNNACVSSVDPRYKRAH